MLSDVLLGGEEATFGSLVPLPTNVHALDEAMRFSASPSGFVALVGPTGWGKTHLLRACAQKIAYAGQGAPEFASTLEHLASPPRSEPAVLILDDMQEAIGRPRVKQQLRLMLERRMRGGKPTMVALTLPRGSRSAQTLLPQPRDWQVQSVGVPSATERVLLLSQMSESMGLKLSAGLIRAVGYHMHGDGRTLAGALKRLRLQSASWPGPRDTLRACGVLPALLFR
jgi:chromosomal replication initiation ATPase DnaA